MFCAGSDDTLQSFGKLTANQHYLPATACTAHSYICAHPVNDPLITATRVLLAHLHPVAGADFDVSHGYITPFVPRRDAQILPESSN